jgi:hypothetical protein
MWTSKIVEKGIEKGELAVNVFFTNGTDSFNQLYKITNAGDDLDGYIKSRLSQLNSVASINVALGDYTPKAATPNLKTDYQNKLARIVHFKTLVDLGIITTSALEYKTAQADLLAAYDPTFI